MGKKSQDRGSGEGVAVAEGPTVWGWVRVWAGEEGVRAVEWPREKRAVSSRRPGSGGGRAEELAQQGLTEVAEYLAGERLQFSVPVDTGELSAFTRQVLEACRRVPYGQTVCYGELAKRVGKPGAARAVGQALGRNPVPLIVPCHRVVASGGELGGFGGGVELKRRLLALERKGVAKEPTGRVSDAKAGGIGG